MVDNRGFLSSVTARILRYFVPMILGGVMVAIYFQAGVSRSAQGKLPLAITLPAAVGGAASSSGSGIPRVNAATPNSETSYSKDSADLIVIAPSNRVLSYESSSASPIEIDPNESESSSTTAVGTTTQAPTPTAGLDSAESTTTTTAPVPTTTEPSGDASTTTTSHSSDGAPGDN